MEFCIFRMMMYKYCCSIQLFLFLAVIANAQSINGKISDPNGKPLGSIVIMLKKDTVLIKAELTNDEGYYRLQVPHSGKYTFSFSGIGFLEVDSALNIAQNVELNLVMHPAVGQLAQVVVNGKRPLIERKIDRFVFNVDKNISAIGADGLDMLAKTPMVKVDNDGGLSLVGRGDVKVMINEKMIYLYGPALVAYLRAIPAETIDRIEVITNPSARYDAAGGAGLINIVLKKTKNPGFSGAANGGLAKGTYFTGTGGLLMNYNTSTIRWVANASSGYGAHANNSEDDDYYSDQTWYRQMNLKQLTRFVRGTIGMEASLSPKTILGVSYNALTSSPTSTGTNNTTVVNQHGLTDSTLQSLFDYKSHYGQQSVNVHLGHDIDSLGKKFALDLDWFYDLNNSPSATQNANYLADGQVTPGSTLNLLSIDNLKSNLYTLNATLDWPMKKFTYAFGSKLTLANSNSQRALFEGVNDPLTLSAPYDNFNYRESTEAAFGTVDTHLGKWEVQTGLRGEYTQTRAVSPVLDSTHATSYFSLFPSLNLSRNIGSKNVVTASYGRRIDRPVFRSLDPYPTYSDQYDFTTGNPYLRPTYSNNIEFSETYNSMLILTATYSYIPNKIMSMVLVENGSNMHITTFGNYLTAQDYVLSASFSFNKIPWLESLIEGDVYYEKGTSTDTATPPQVSGWGSDFSSTNTFYFNKSKKLSAGFDMTFQFPDVSNLVTSGKYHWFDLFARWSLVNNKLQIGAYLNDVFKTKYPSGTYTVNSVIQHYRINSDSRRGGVTLRYSFGNTKMKRGQVHSGLDGETGRVN